MSGSDNRWLVRSIVFAQFGPAFMFSGVAIALPHMGKELSMSATSLGLVETTFIASSTAFLLPAGRLVDVASRGAIFRWSLAAFGVLSLLLGLVNHVWVVLLLRVLQGLAAALCTAAGPALLMDLVPSERRGRIFGAMLGMAYAGLALGPFAAGWIIDQLGWRSVFYVGGAWILIGGIPALVQIKEKWRRPTSGMHWPSVLLIVFGMASVVAAVSAGERNASPWPWAAAASALLGGFVVWQARLTSPLLDLRELRANAVLRGALGVQSLLYLNAYCSIFLLSLFLQVSKGLDAPSAGLWLATGALVMAVVAPSAGRLADRMRPQRVAGLGVVSVLASSVLGYQLGAGSPAWHVGLVLGVQGLGFGLFSSPNLSLIIGSLPRAQSGFASAVAAQSRGIGMFAGMAVTSALIASQFGARAVDEDGAGVIAIVQRAYVVLLVTSALALLLAVGGALRVRVKTR
ncbi:MAG: MFS family permease [Planctomycetota bacterium]